MRGQSLLKWLLWLSGLLLDVCFVEIGLWTNFGTDVVALVVAVYAILFMNWDTKGTPFDGVSASPFFTLNLLGVSKDDVELCTNYWPWIRSERASSLEFRRYSLAPLLAVRGRTPTRRIEWLIKGMPRWRKFIYVYGRYLVYYCTIPFLRIIVHHYHNCTLDHEAMC